MPTCLRVAENYRYEEAYQEACDIARTLGTITKLDLVADMAMTEANKCAREFGADGRGKCGGGTSVGEGQAGRG
eukprot:355531-Chlamydomonas_euryale.AAC.6